MIYKQKITPIKTIVFATIVSCFISSCNTHLNNDEEQNQRDKHNQNDTNHPKQFSWVIDTCSSWSDITNGNTVKYCIKVSNNNLGKALYAFHGMGGDEKFCDHISRDTDIYKDSNISHIICPSFGASWTIHENNRADSLVRFMDYIASTYSGASDQPIVLYGESMGGFNAIKLSGIKQGKFSRVAVSCPAIFSSTTARLAVNTIPASWFPNNLFGGFNKETALSIIGASPYFDASSFPEMLIHANENDAVGRVDLPRPVLGPIPIAGIYNGAKDFYNLLRGQQKPISFKQIPGQHCEGISLKEMIQFLDAK